MLGHNNGHTSAPPWMLEAWSLLFIWALSHYCFISLCLHLHLFPFNSVQYVPGLSLWSLYIVFISFVSCSVCLLVYRLRMDGGESSYKLRLPSPVHLQVCNCLECCVQHNHAFSTIFFAPAGIKCSQDSLRPLPQLGLWQVYLRPRCK